MSDRWPFVELGDAGVAVLDCEHRTPPDSGVGHPYIAIPNLVDGRLDLRNVRRITSDRLREWTRRTQPRAGDVIVTRRGRVGDSAVIPEGLECAIGQNLVILRSVGDRVDQRYLRWATRGPLWASEVDRLRNVGAVFDSLNVREISRLRIPLPPQTDQRAIAELLTALDEKILLNERVSSTSRWLAQTLFLKSVREGHSLRMRLVSAVNVLTRGVAPKYAEDSSGLLILNQKCVRDGQVSLGSARRSLTGKIPNDKLLHVNDVLVNSTGAGTLGRVARWKSKTPATVDSHITIVRFDPERLDPICGGLAMLAAQSQIERLGEGSTGQTELSRERLGKLELELPTPQRAAELHPLLASLDQVDDNARKQIQILSELRDTLLPKVVAGELRIRDSERAARAAV